MSDLVKLLKRFNRKERFFLIRQALDLPQNEFRLSEDFRKKLGRKIGLDDIGVEIPCDAFAAMDYHLDWVTASVAAFCQESVAEIFCNQDKAVTGTQEDIDFLIAFQAQGDYHLVFLEAKAYASKGYASWGSQQFKDQVNSKIERLERIFGPDGGNHSKIKPHFCLVSHARPEIPTTDAWTASWPKWMKSKDTKQPYWLKLCLPSDRWRVTRYDPAKRKPSQQGKHFKIVKA